MFGLPIFRKSILSIDCNACGRRFEPSTGGVCSQCQRILCFTHLHGTRIRRVLMELGARPVCVACRRGESPPTARK